MWYGLVSTARWATFAELRTLYPSADLVGNCTVFNVSGNRFRLIARVFFGNHKVYVLRILTHAQYDRTDWIRDCACHSPPPKPARKKPGVPK